MKKLVASVVVASLVSSMLGVARATIYRPRPLDDVMTGWINADTGNVLIDTGGLNVSGWGVFSTGGIFTGDPANIDVRHPILTTDNDFEVSTGFVDFNGFDDLGNIIGEQYRNQPIDFYAQDISGHFTAPGEQGLFNMSFHVNPEPSSFLLAALGLIGLLAYAWRHRRAKIV